MTFRRNRWPSVAATIFSSVFAFALMFASRRSYAVTDNISINIGWNTRECIISAYGYLAWGGVSERLNAISPAFVTWKSNDPADSLDAKGGRTGWFDDSTIKWRWKWCVIGAGSTDRMKFWICPYEIIAIPFGVITLYLLIPRRRSMPIANGSVLARNPEIKKSAGS